ncbi:hypothetical protein [Globicatella sulfidifaciens]|uniref:Uncharacterized protein n=1 Tax=Globicatella sulfidifaciens TaxID=136093 RepID=A0A7X8GZV6_9LACT|nr:hypothetical protein [Globicatella sulfidifaciens]NLJ18209.1 hypothetical protein [Globicatella sulfidifaciens]
MSFYYLLGAISDLRLTDLKESVQLSVTYPVAIKTSTYLSDLNFIIEQGGITHFINPSLELKQRIDEIVNAFEKIVYVTAPITYRKHVS